MGFLFFGFEYIFNSFDENFLSYFHNWTNNINLSSFLNSWLFAVLTLLLSTLIFLLIRSTLVFVAFVTLLTSFQIISPWMGVFFVFTIHVIKVAPFLFSGLFLKKSVQPIVFCYFILNALTALIMASQIDLFVIYSHDLKGLLNPSISSLSMAPAFSHLIFQVLALILSFIFIPLAQKIINSFSKEKTPQKLELSGWSYHVSPVLGT